MSDTELDISSPITKAQSLHNSISQIASIRIQAELLQINLADEDQRTREGLDRIVGLTTDVQTTLAALLAEARGE